MANPIEDPAIAQLTSKEEEFATLRNQTISIHDMWFSLKFVAAYIAMGAAFIGTLMTFSFLSSNYAFQIFLESSNIVSAEAILAISIAAGMIPLVVVTFRFNLELQRHNVRLNVTYSELRDLREKVASIKQELRESELPEPFTPNRYELADAILQLINFIKNIARGLDAPSNIRNDIIAIADQSVRDAERLMKDIRENSNQQARRGIDIVIYALNKLRNAVSSYAHEGRLEELNQHILALYPALFSNLLILADILRREPEEDTR